MYKGRSEKAVLTKNEIKGRVIRNAAQYWGLHNTNLLDPVVTLLLEAIANESFKLHQECAAIEGRLLSQLAALLSPGAFRTPSPAHTILHARSIDPVFRIKEGKQLAYIEEPAGGQEPARLNAHFKPVWSTTLFNGDIDILVTPLTVYTVKDGLYREALASPGGPPRKNEIWLGISLDNAVTTIKGMSFFASWIGMDDQYELCSLLGACQWYLGDGQLQIKQGPAKREERSPPGANMTDWRADSRHLQLMLHEIAQLYEQRFVTVMDDVPDWRRYVSLYPDAFSYFFASDILNSIFQAERLWIRIKFPLLATSHLLDTIQVSINAFPAVNMNNRNISSDDNIIPLRTGRRESFLAVERVRSLSGIEYAADLLAGDWEPHDLKRYIISNSLLERFDSRDAQQQLLYLMELIDDERLAFRALHIDEMTTMLKEVKEKMEMIRRIYEKYADPSAERDKYLVITGNPEGEHFFVDYWTTNGAHVNELPPGTALAEYSGTDLDGGKAVLLTATAGGREAPDEKELLAAYKYALLSDNKVITAADIEHFMQMELGNKLAGISIKPGIMKEKHTEGLVRCVEIKLVLSQECAQLSATELANMAEMWKVKLRQRSAPLSRYSIRWEVASAQVTE